MSEPTGVGYFGKLPGAGDFVRRRLPPDFIDRWDRCFEAALCASRGVFGANWRAGWRASPVWRFALAPGVCGASAWVGLMGPSMDRVGRGFPMVLAAPLDDANAVARVLRGGARWFAALQCVHAEAQADDASDAAAFEAKMLQLPGPLDVLANAPAEPGATDWAFADHWRVPWLRTAGEELLRRWSDCVAARDGCLWWTHGGARVPPTILMTRGLPEPAAYAGFLDAAYAPTPWQNAAGFDAPATPAPSPPPPGASRQVHVLPADMDDVLGDLLPPVSPMEDLVPPAPPAHDFRESEPLMAGTVAGATVVAEAPPSSAVAVTRRGALTLIAADDGPPDPRRQAAVAVRAAIADLPDGLPALDMHALHARLLAIHPRLLERREDLINPVAEDGAVIAACVAADRVDVLRIGNAAGWHWRRGQLRPMFVAAPSPSSDDDTERKDAFGNLVAPQAYRPVAGLGAAETPGSDAVACAVEPGDRLLLAATEKLARLSEAVLASALALPTCEDAHAHVAMAARLEDEPAAWPFTVIEVGT